MIDRTVVISISTTLVFSLELYILPKSQDHSKVVDSRAPMIMMTPSAMAMDGVFDVVSTSTLDRGIYRRLTEEASGVEEC